MWTGVVGLKRLQVHVLEGLKEYPCPFEDCELPSLNHSQLVAHIVLVGAFPLVSKMTKSRTKKYKKLLTKLKRLLTITNLLTVRQYAHYSQILQSICLKDTTKGPWISCNDGHLHDSSLHDKDFFLQYYFSKLLRYLRPTEKNLNWGFSKTFFLLFVMSLFVLPHL